MQVFRDLILRSPNRDEGISSLRDIKEDHPPNWEYMSELIKSYLRNSANSLNEGVVCFKSPKLQGPSRAIDGYVWMGLWDAQVEIMNIVPTAVGELNFSEYNLILKEFYNQVVSPKLNKYHFEVEFTKSNPTMEEIAGESTAKALEIFASFANPSTGRGNPQDYARWLEFVSTAYKENSKLTPEELGRFLWEEEGWKSDEVVVRLQLDYEYGLNLLKHYAKYHQS